MNAELRPFEARDQSGLEALFSASWSGSRSPFDPAGAHSDLRRIPEAYPVSGGGFWVLEGEGALLGAIALRRLSERVAEVKRFVVLPRQRGLGLGDRLLRHALAQAASSRFDRVRLDTIRAPGPALHLFQKHGFVEIERYNDNPDADLFMERSLGGAPE